MQMFIAATFIMAVVNQLLRAKFCVDAYCSDKSNSMINFEPMKHT